MPPFGSLAVAVAVVGLAWYLAQVLGWFNGDIVDYQRYLDRFVGLGALPYEYPPAALLVFTLTALPHLAWPIPTFTAWMAVPVLAGYLATWRVKGPRAAFAYLALLAAGALATMLSRFDILPSLLVLGALWSAQRGRWAGAYLLLVAGALLKLYPLALLPVFALAQLRGGQPAGRVARSAAPGAGLLAAGVLVPLALFGTASLAFLRNLFLARPAELESLPAVAGWALGGGHARFDFGQVGFDGRYVGAAGAVCLLLLAATYAWVLLRVWRGTLELGPAAILTVAALIAFSRVLSPQYLLWALPLVASEEGVTPAWLGVALLTTLAYPILWLGAATVAPPLMLTLLARDLLLAGLVLKRAGAGSLLAALAARLRRPPWPRLLLAALVLGSLEILAGEAAGVALTAAVNLHSPDFIAFYTAARIVLAGHGAQLYDLAQQTSVQAALTAGWGGRRFLLAFPEPPQDALLVAPLGWLPYRAAYLVMVGVQLLAISAATWLTVRAERFPAAWRWPAALAAMATLPVFVDLVQGQVDGLALLGLAVIRADWERPTWRTAVGAGLVLTKPHLAAIVLLLLLTRRATAPWLAVAGGVSLAVAAIAFRPAVWLDWLRLVVPTASGVAEGWLTGHEDRLALAGQLEALRVPSLYATGLDLLALAALAGLLLLRRRASPEALAAAAAGSVLLSPHVNIHDQVLLLAPMLFVLAALVARPDPWTAAALAAALLAVDASLLVSPGLVVAGVGALVLATLRLWWSAPAGGPDGEPRRPRSPAREPASAPPRPAPRAGSA